MIQIFYFLKLFLFQVKHWVIWGKLIITHSSAQMCKFFIVYTAGYSCVYSYIYPAIYISCCVYSRSIFVFMASKGRIVQSLGVLLHKAFSKIQFWSGHLDWLLHKTCTNASCLRLLSFFNTVTTFGILLQIHFTVQNRALQTFVLKKIIIFSSCVIVAFSSKYKMLVTVHLTHAKR